MIPRRRRSPHDGPRAGAVCRRSIGYPVAMTKRLIDVDDAKLAAVRELLDTDTLKATVDGAFDEVIALDVRRRHLLKESLDGLAGFADPEARESAWR